VADLELSDFDVIPWTPGDEDRPDITAPPPPEQLSGRGQRVLAANARLRGTWDETLNHYPSDSERAYAFTFYAGEAGLSCEDATWLLREFYSRSGKKQLHQTKLAKTLRAWAKGREVAEREEAGHPKETVVEQAVEDVGSEDAFPTETATQAKTAHEGDTRRAKGKNTVQPFEVLPAAEFLQADFAGATRLVERVGLTECGVGLLTAAGGDGKSLAMQNLECGWTGVNIPLAEALPAARRLRILGFQVENAPGMEQERLRKILGTARPPDGLFLFTRKEPIRFSGAKGRPNERALERLSATLAAHAPIDLVVFDPLVYLHEAEENSSSEMMRWLVPLREVCRRVGAAILVVHHAGWAGDGDDARGRGSTAIRAWADFELALRAQTRNGRELYRLNLVKTNFAPRWKEALTLELNEQTLRFQAVDETGTLCPPDALVVWLEEDHNGTWAGPRADLYAAIEKRFGCSERTAKDAVSRAKVDGRLKDYGQRKPLEVVAYSPELNRE